MGKNVAVFVDVANIFYAAKAAGTDIDYVTLLKAATAGRDFVRAYAYTGLDPENENQRNFHSFLARNHYKVVSKDIRKYGDGKVKANLDIELVVDLMKTARNLDIAIVVSGDGDFAPAIRAVQEMGVRVEVISFRGNTSSDLIEVADLFTDITQLARVDKTSSRSGRRVAGDEEDLSMTEVPDKQTEGTGTRGRGRGRGRTSSRDGEIAASNGRRRTARPAAEPAVASANGGGGLVALPGEKLSRVSGTPVEDGIDDEELEAEEAFESAGLPEDGSETEEGARRRRRRRGGRGRGRGRGRADEGLESEPTAAAAPAGPDSSREDVEDLDEDLAPPAPRSPRTTPFGSVWDSQLGVPSASAGAPRPAIGPVDEEDFEEPEIPEYLIAEQRRGRGGQGQGQGRGGGRGGPRGGRSAYTAAIERERYGTGGSRSSGFNRYPDVSGRDRQPSRGGGGGGGGNRQGGFRQDRPDRVERSDRPVRSSGGDPWSEVPPELEEMLRAQLAQSGKSRPAAPVREPGAAGEEAVAQPQTAAISDAVSNESPKPAARRRTARSTASKVTNSASADAATAEAAAATPKRRTTRRTAATTADSGGGEAVPSGDAESAAPKRRTTRRTASATADESGASAGASAGAPEEAAAAPKRRATRKKAEPA